MSLKVSHVHVIGRIRERIREHVWRDWEVVVGKEGAM